MMTANIKHFAQNTDGRDFVVGDIHGCFSLLDDALTSARFNPDTDRLFCVGDLVDYGPESHKAMDYLAKPWFHSVRGDHEYEIPNDIMHMRKMSKESIREEYQKNGMGWLLDLSPAEQDDICHAFTLLPITMEVNFGAGEVAGLIHAEVPIGLNWHNFIDEIAKVNPDTVRSALKGRQRITCQYPAENISGISRIFSGHSLAYTRGAISHGNCIFLDTGAVLRQRNVPEINFPDIPAADYHLTVAQIDAPIQKLTAKRPNDDNRPFHVILS